MEKDPDLAKVPVFIVINKIDSMKPIREWNSDTLIGPSIAFSLTYVSGLIINDLFSSGNINPTKEQLQELSQKYKGELKKAKKFYEENEQ